MCDRSYYLAEVEDMLPGFVMKYRSLRFGKGGGGMGWLGLFDTSLSSMIELSLRRDEGSTLVRSVILMSNISNKAAKLIKLQRFFVPLRIPGGFA